MAATSTTIQYPLKPPNYILQSWHREQIDSEDKHRFQQTFVIAPDGTVPLSRFRQRLRKIYEKRTEAIVVVHCDPWDKARQITTLITPAKDLVKSYWTL